MNITRFLAVALYTLALVACASTQPSSAPTAKDTTASTSTQATAATASNLKKIICKKVTPTGSRLGTKTCKSAEIWKAEAHASQKALNDITRRSKHANPEGT